MSLRKNCREPIRRLTCFTDFGISSIFRNFPFLSFPGCKPSSVMTFPRERTFSDPKTHFTGDSEKIRLLYFEWLKLVMISKCCRRANSTCSSSRKWIGVGGLRVKTGWSCSGVSFMEISELTPTSNLCFAKISKNSTNNSSICFSFVLSIDSFHLNLCRIWLRYSSLKCGGFLLSSSCSFWSSVNIFFSTPFSVVGFLHVSGVGNLKLL